jgi:serine O-acetyltransferase
VSARQAIRAFIVETFLVDDFPEDASFLRTGIMDSLGMVRLVAFLEETFRIAIADDELLLENLDSLERVAAFVGRKRDRSAAGRRHVRPPSTGSMPCGRAAAMSRLELQAPEKELSRSEGDPERPFRADLKKYYRIVYRTESPTAAERLRLWATHLGLHCVAAYRMERFARRVASGSRWLGLPFAISASLLGHGLELLHHVRIYADIGPGFFIGHAGMILIGPTVIGRNFSVTHNVTIGFGQSAAAKGYPVIGDDVWVGTGSVISGAIRVGDGATIANGTMLSRSVPPRSLSAGNPGRLVLQGYDNSSLLGARRAGLAGEDARKGLPDEVGGVPS